ncbi:MAG: ATP-binding protein [Candidatus Saccharibacteria bacterium]|nr:ATP-binding protein [Candidatus Saccharibacteria bacterium]
MIHDWMWVGFALLALIFVVLAALTYRRQRQAETALRHSRVREKLEYDRAVTLTNNLTDAVFSMDEHGFITMYNAAALNLLDTNASINGVFIDDLLKLSTTDKQPLSPFQELQRLPSIRRRDDIILSFEGDDGDDIVRLDATFAPIQGGDSLSPDGYVLILQDITRIKSLEEERDEFISVVSHELRTPITIAEASLSNAQLMAERGMTDRLEQAIVDAHKQVLFLARMVNDLSTLSRAERGVADEAEVIDVTELAQQLHREYAPQAQEKELAFDLDVRSGVGSVHTSRLYLEELLQNFITNAIKYTQQGSITLIIKRSAGQIYFGVKDTGIGIGRSDQKQIFDRFFRAEDYRTRETNGTGLGLYVAAKLAKKMGCTITLTSRLNHGSTFSFTLPPVPKSDDT